MGARDFNPAEPRGPHGEWTGFGAHHQKLTDLVGKSFESRYPTSGAKAADEVEATGHATVSGHGPLAERRAEQARALLESKGIHAKTEKIHRFGGKEIRIYDPKRQPSTKTLLEDVGADLHKGDLAHVPHSGRTVMGLQYRIAPEGEVRDVDETKRQVHVVIPFEVIDSYNTDFERSCFDDFFANRLPVMCWQHIRSEPIGRTASHQRTQTSHEFVNQFSDFDAVPRARQAFAQIRDKEITDFSFGFDQAKSIPHPEVRGAIRFTSARMPEISPVTIGAIPGAVAVGIRAEAEIANVRGLLEAGAIDEDGANEMLRAAGLEPLPRQRIETGPPGDVREAVNAALREMFAGQRSVTITIGDDGSISTTGAPAASDDDEEATPEDLASATDAALDAGQAIIDNTDTTALPDDVQQALALFAAAGVAVDELLEAMGVDDPDEDETGRAADDGGERAVSDAPWNFEASAYSIDQLKRACLIVLDGGKTKDDCKLPVRTPGGALSRNACHAAAAALAGGRGGVQAPMGAKVAAAKTLAGLYRSQLKEDPPASLLKLAGEGGGRSTEDEELDLQVRMALAGWHR